MGGLAGAKKVFGFGFAFLVRLCAGKFSETDFRNKISNMTIGAFWSMSRNPPRKRKLGKVGRWQNAKKGILQLWLLSRQKTKNIDDKPFLLFLLERDDKLGHAAVTVGVWC
jgi:hypothetical protein